MSEMKAKMAAAKAKQQQNIAQVTMDSSSSPPSVCTQNPFVMHKL
jgi:hypothetical protein